MKSLKRLLIAMIALTFVFASAQVSVKAASDTDLKSMQVYSVDTAGAKKQLKFNFKPTTYKYDFIVVTVTATNGAKQVYTLKTKKCTPAEDSQYKEGGKAAKKSSSDKKKVSKKSAKVEMNGKEYKILYASITYFRLKVGDQVTVIIPANNDEASWAAVEANI